MSDEARISYEKPDPREIGVLLGRHQLWLDQPTTGAALQFQPTIRDFREFDFGDHRIEKAIFQRCTFAGRTSWPKSLKGCQFVGCDLTGATFEGVDLSDAVFAPYKGPPDEVNCDLTKVVLRDCDLTKAAFTHAVLDDTRFEDCHIPSETEKPTVTFNRCQGERTQFENAEFLRKASFEQVILIGASFKGAHLEHSTIESGQFLPVGDVDTDFSGAHFDGATIHGPRFTKCNFVGADFLGASMSNVKLMNCDLKGASWREAHLSSVTVNGSVFWQGRHLDGDYAPTLAIILGAELARYSFEKDWFTWERVRKFGTLRLFSVSYLALIAIWLFARGVEWYNHQLESLWLTHELFAKFPLVKDLKMLPVPSDLWQLLIAIGLLALATTLYHVWCPREVLENTESQWKNDLGHEVFAYRVRSFKLPQLRWITGVLYAVGGGWMLIHLLRKIWFVFLFLYNSSSQPPANPEMARAYHACSPCGLMRGEVDRLIESGFTRQADREMIVAQCRDRFDDDPNEAARCVEACTDAILKASQKRREEAGEAR